jgi:hypothetical protein
MMSKNAIIARGANVKPANAKSLPLQVKLQGWRQKICDTSAGIEAELRRGRPYTILRETAKGPVAINTNGHFTVGDSIFVTIPVGPKKLCIGGHTSFRSTSVEDACAILADIRTATLAGELDAEIEAMFSIPEVQKLRMTAGKLIKKVARAEAAGKRVSASDRAKIERLLKNAEYRAAYEDALAA